MGTVPDTKAGKVAFYKSRLAQWSANAVAIGSSAAQIAELSALVAAAETAVNDQNAKQAAAESATETARNALNAMDTLGATVIAGVRYKARTAGDAVYALANIPAPATPGPVAAPGKPEKFKLELLANGAISFSWKCANPVGARGTTYNVYRRFAMTGDWEIAGTCGEKKFVDNDIPAGTAFVVYQVQAIRTTGAGPWAQYIVNFGSAAGPTGTEGTAEDIAA